MSAKIIDGVAVAAAIRTEIKGRVLALKASGIEPGLAVILVGTDPASAVYVRNKIHACNEVGIRSLRYDFQADADPHVVQEQIAQLNEREDVHGILVQLPLPLQFSMSQVLRTIAAVIE